MEIIQFYPKEELEEELRRKRLIKEARDIYESIFPTEPKKENDDNLVYIRSPFRP